MGELSSQLQWAILTLSGTGVQQKTSTLTAALASISSTLRASQHGRTVEQSVTWFPSASSGVGTAMATTHVLSKCLMLTRVMPMACSVVKRAAKVEYNETKQ